MTIETKYNIGDEVWLMAWGIPRSGRVWKITTVSYGSGETEEFYILFGDDGVFSRNRDEIFSTEEEMLNRL
jgi:hypothetical protein